MIRKVLINKSLTFSLIKQNKKISFHSIKMPSLKNSALYSYKFCYQFSSQGEVGSKKNAFDVANQLYSTYRWTEEFVNQIQLKINEFYEHQDFENALILLEFFLQKIKEKIGVNNNLYIFKLYSGIYLCFLSGNFQKSQKWLQILEQSLQKYPQLGRDPSDNSHVLFNVAQSLMLVHKKKQASKWLELFLKKYKNFDETTEVSEKQRFYTYVYLTDCFGSLNRDQQAVLFSKKAFDLAQKQKIKDVQKEGLISAIYNYGVTKLKSGDRQEAMRAFDICEKNFDWNNPYNLDLVAKICLSYIAKGLNDRAGLLLQKLQKQYEQKKHNNVYQNAYEMTLTMRVSIYLSLDKYEKLYQALKYSKSKQKKAQGQLDISLYILLALCQLKSGNKQSADISLHKSLTIAQSIKNPSYDFEPEKELYLIEVVQAKLIEELTSQHKQIIRKIKQILMKMKNKN